MADNQNSMAIAFDIVFNDKVAKSPAAFNPQKYQCDKKNALTLEDIEKKQQLAERRREERIAARLKRIQLREEATKKLAESFDVLLQQQFMEIGGSSNVPRMSQREVIKTAKDFAQMYMKMQQQLLRVDLKVDEMPVQLPCRKYTSDRPRARAKNKTDVAKKGKPSQDKPRKPKGMAFEIPLDEVKEPGQCKTKPSGKVLQARNATVGRKLTAEELDEKQQKAAERRQKRKDEKVRKTCEANASLMELRRKVNIYIQHQAALRGEEDPEKILSKGDAAWIAHEIANGYSKIYSRYQTDLDRAGDFHMVFEKCFE